jgi:hypothetical protein
MIIQRGEPMKIFGKVALVLAGYAAAMGVTGLAFWARQTLFPNLQASQAFGDMIFFLALWAFLSLFPTALAIYFLRTLPGIWMYYTWACLGFALTAPLVVVGNAFLIFMGPPQGIWALAGFLSLMRAGAAPFLALAYLASSGFAPKGRARHILWAAAGLEFLAFITEAVFLLLHGVD